MPNLVVAKVPSNLLVPLIFEASSSVPQWNKKVVNYVYSISGFANKYLHAFRVMVFFHDDDLVFKEIKLFLENNGYGIHSRWAIINTLLHMSFDIKGKMVRFFPHS
jgi:hypothetical protein